MKQKDLALILVIIVVSAVMSLVISKMIITKPENREQKVEVIQPISDKFSTPDKRYFTNDSINPTQPLATDQATNSNPFNGTSSQ